MTATKQALCCVCGAIRTCQRPRNHREENHWLRGPIDLDWHRETGDLKCDSCSRITTHAILLPDNIWRDHAETLHREAIGYYTKTLTADERQRIQQAWRQGLPRNPLRRHISWVSDETKARAAGETHVIAICREMVPLPKRVTKPGDGVDSDVLMKPRKFHDVDYEDPETGLWWYDVTCTDCLLRSNAIAVNQQRAKLRERLIEAVATVSKLDARTVAHLLEQFNEEASDAS